MAFKADKIKANKFLYGLKTTRGQKVIRSGWSSMEFHLFFNIRIKGGLLHYVGQKNILKSKEVAVIETPCPDLEALSRGLPGEDKSYLAPNPKGWWNPSKNTPTFFFRLATGSATFLENTEDFKKFLLNSPKLKGLFVLERESHGSPMFNFKRSAGPGGPL